MENIVIVALISAASGIFGAIIAGAWQRGKTQAEAEGVKADTNEQIRETVMNLLNPLRERIFELECDKEDLKLWAERLVCQVKEAGLEPVKFQRVERQRPAADEPKTGKRPGKV